MKIRKFNEGAPNYDLLNQIENSNSWADFSRKLMSLVEEYKSSLKDEIGYDEGDTDDDRAFNLSIQSALGDQF